jgi:Flp pilus assembly protein TadD
VLLFAVLVTATTFAAQQAPPNSSTRHKPATPARVRDAAHLNNLGVAYMNQQRFTEALRSFRQAAALDSKMSLAIVNRGIALANLPKYAAAAAVLSAVVRQDRANARAWYVLGLVYRHDGSPARALDCLLTTAKLAPNDPDVFYFIGVVQSEMGEYEKAITNFQQALALNHFHASAEFALARALQRLGKADQAAEHLARFQHMVQARLGTPMSLAYGDQGMLSLALPVAEANQPSTSPLPVRFADVSRESGLSWETEADTTAQTGSGACFFDFDNDGRPDLFLANGGPEGGMALLHNTGRNTFVDVTRKAALDPKLHGIACAAGDYDNDGRTDLVVSTSNGVVIFHNQGDGAFKDVTQAVGIHPQAGPLGVTFIDYDHDGDIDLFVTGREPGKNMVWRNNGNSTFTDVTADFGFAGDTANFAVAAVDFNNDRAVDLIFAAGKPELFLNPREGKWKRPPLWDQPVRPPVNAIITLDFNKDGWMDVALTHDGAPGITLWRNVDGREVEQVPLPALHWRRAWGVVAVDYDNDGWIDLAATGETEDGRREIRLLRNLGEGGFKDVTAEVGLDTVKLSSPQALLAADVDRDGDTDLLVTQASGLALLLRNAGGNRNHFLRLSLKGLADNRGAVGAKVEVFAGTLWQKWEVGGSGYLSQSATEILVGLGKESRVDIVRTLWPTGVVQDEADVAADRSFRVGEIDRRGSSCPVLFAFDGKHYRFIADTLGAGVVGHWVGPGERNIPDSTEYIKVDGDHTRLRRGLLSFRYMEPLEEVVYLDQARAVAIDHHRDLDVYPNEYFASNPPFADFKVIASRNPRPLARAWDDHGKDVSDLLRYRDQRYVSGFELLSYKGFTNSHALELELPTAYQGGPLRLLLYGYIEYFMANSMYAAWQAGINPVAPYLEAMDRTGKWVRVLDDMGFPAGLPRTTVADLTGKLPLGAKRLRMITNLQIYWDQILVDTTPDVSRVIKITDVPLASARLAFRGFPRLREHASPGDFEFVYEEASPTGPFTRPIGAYTRLGDVRALLLNSDDRFVVFGSGDEVQLDFNPAKLPPLPAGWKRDYFFFVDGYEKDMDFYAAQGDFVGPLPFHFMSQYPYTNESYPQDATHLSDQLDYDTRLFSQTPPVSYRLRYKDHIAKAHH